MSKTDVTQSYFLDGIKTNTRLAVIVGILFGVKITLSGWSLILNGRGVSGVAKEAACEVSQ